MTQPEVKALTLDDIDRLKKVAKESTTLGQDGGAPSGRAILAQMAQSEFRKLRASR